SASKLCWKKQSQRLEQSCGEQRTVTAKYKKPDVITYGDHEVITPDTMNLRKTVRAATPEEEADDPVTRAEEALEQIASDFGALMTEECERPDAARINVRDGGLSKANRQELFRAAHDVKVDSTTFGYPKVVPAAESLCRLLELAPNANRIPMTIID